MKLEVSNSNYACTVIRVRNLVQLSGMDRCVGIPVYGYQVIVGKDSVSVGDIGLLFTAETQLSPDFLRNNSLYRHKEKNLDGKKAGYFEDNGRVRSIKLKGNVSSAFYIPLSALSYLGAADKLKEGDTFTSIDGVEVCRKFVRKETQPRGNRTRQPAFSRIDSKLFPEHVDTDNWWKNEHKIEENELLIVTQKLHGTSARFTRQSVQRELTWRERVAKFFGVQVAHREYVPLVGTRRTIRDISNKSFFYEHDVWNDHMAAIQGIIPKNWVVYGEIIGWAGQSPIQHNYTYDLPQGESRLYVYRISIVNEDGVAADLSWDSVCDWCDENGLEHVPEICRCRKFDFDASELVEQRFVDSGRTHCVQLSDPSSVDEGVVVRVEGLRPYVLKAKSPSFLVYESGAIDKGAVDLEESQS